MHFGDTEAKDVHTLIPVPRFSMYLVGRSRSVDVVDLDSSTILTTFKTELMQPRSLRQISLSRTQQSNLTSLTLAYTQVDTGDLILHTYLPEDEGDAIYSYNPAEASDGRRRPWSSAKTITRHITDQGVWDALSNGSIVGIRQRPRPQTQQRSLPTAPISGLRRRGGNPADPDSYASSNESWEAWVMNHLESTGDFETKPLVLPNSDEQDPAHLMISELGPMVQFGAGSVAVGFGNVIKIISAGHEHFDSPINRAAQAHHPRSLIARRRKAAAASQRARGSL